MREVHCPHCLLFVPVCHQLEEEGCCLTVGKEGHCTARDCRCDLPHHTYRPTTVCGRFDYAHREGRIAHDYVPPGGG